MVREDYLGALEPYVGVVPTRLSSTYRLDLLKEDAAREAIQGPAKERGVTFTPEATKALIDNLATVKVPGPDGAPVDKTGSYVEPVQLQVVCSRLWEEWQNEAPKTQEITKQDIEKIGNVDKALAEYYQENVVRVATDSKISERAIREWFDHKLIMPPGIRSQVKDPPDDTREVIKNVDDIDVAEKEALKLLLDSHLVRGEERRGVTWYELAHDRLIGPVRTNNADWFKKQSLLQRSARFWFGQGKPEHLLLRGQELKEAQSWADKNREEVIPVENAFLANCRDKVRGQRRNRLIIAGFVFFLLFLALREFWSNVQKVRTLSALRIQGMSRQLAAQSQAKRDDERDLALLLGIEAWKFGEQSVIRGVDPATAILVWARNFGNATKTQAALKPAVDASARASAAIFRDAGSALFSALSQSPQMITYLRGPSSRLWQVSVSPQGRFVAAADETGNIWLWDGEHKKSSSTLGQKGAPVRSMAFSRDGKALITGDSSGKIVLWDIASKASSKGDSRAAKH